MRDQNFIETNEEIVMGISSFNKLSLGELNGARTNIIYNQHKNVNITFKHIPNSGKPYFVIDFNNNNPSLIIDCEDEYERITDKNNKITEIYKGVVRGVGTRMWVTLKKDSRILIELDTRKVLKLYHE